MNANPTLDTAIIFNVWHHKLFSELLNEVPEEDARKVVLLGVNEKYPKEYDKSLETKFRMMYEYELAGYDSKWQDKGYCQTSCMYHLYFHPELYEDRDYIGFLQYDMKIEKDAIKNMEIGMQALKVKGEELIFAVGLMDIRGVALLDPLVFEHGLAHYNKYFGTTWSVQDVLSDERCKYAPLLHTFIIPVPMFRRMMGWMTDYMRHVEKWGTAKKARASIAEYMERIHGLFLALECKRTNVQMVAAQGIQHEWPKYHNQTEFLDYKKQASQNEI